MIVPMKKVYIVVLDKEKSQAVKDLAKLGVLHVEQEVFPQDEKLHEILKELDLVNTVINILEKNLNSNNYKNLRFSNQFWDKYALHIVDLDRRIFQLEEYKQKLIQEIKEYKDWKDFSPSEVQELKERGIYLKFYLIPKKEIKNISKEFFIQKVFSKKDTLGCIVIGYRKEPILNFKEVPLPKMSLNKMKQRLEEAEKKRKELLQELANFTQLKEEFLKIKSKLEEEILFLKTVLGMQKLDPLAYISGYVPSDNVRSLENLAKNNSWAILIRDPSDLDNVPTLIRNPKWIKIIEPVFKFLELLPGYNELDISFLFLVFFSLFFGIIIADAGYGLVYLGLTYFFHKKFSKKVKDKLIFPLFYLLSLTAVIWGALSGAFFGQGAILRPIIPILRDNLYLQKFCLFLGVLHLSIAHLWRGVLKFPRLDFISEFGWISIILGSFYVACNLVLGESWSWIIKWFYLVGIILVMFFSSPSKNLFLGLIRGIGNVFSNLVSTFTDLVSYIRLFAVGLATVAVADAFNKMAGESGFSSFTRGLVSSLILVSGHLLNILLGPMSVLVHGVRLNVLEFSNHLNLKWKGFAYKPLSLKEVK